MDRAARPLAGECYQVYDYSDAATCDVAPKVRWKVATPKFAHVVLQTSNLEGMRDFYCKLLDGHVVYEGKGLCFVTFDEEHHRIAFLSPPVQLEPKSPM